MTKPASWRVWLALPLLALPGCAWEVSKAPAQDEAYAIEHVTVLPMTAGGGALPDSTVVIRAGRIAALGPSSSVRCESCARRIDGRGKWLMPGLADMHVHIPNRSYGAPDRSQAELLRTSDLMLPFLANGVTQIFELGATAASLEQRAEIDSGKALGPHLATAAMIDGSPPVWAGRTHVVATPEEGREAVRQVQAAGFDFVKVYSRLDVPPYQAILDEGRARGIRVLGHLPNAAKGDIEAVIGPGIALVAHAEEFAKQSTELSDADIERYAQAIRANGTWVTPTLITMVWIARQTRSLETVRTAEGLQYVHPLLLQQWLHANRYAKSATPQRVERFDRFVDFNARLTRAFAAAGVSLRDSDAVGRRR